MHLFHGSPTPIDTIPTRGIIAFHDVTGALIDGPYLYKVAVGAFFDYAEIEENFSADTIERAFKIVGADTQERREEIIDQEFSTLESLEMCAQFARRFNCDAVETWENSTEAYLCLPTCNIERLGILGPGEDGQTIADQVSELLGGDGQVWVAGFDYILEENAKYTENGSWVDADDEGRLVGEGRYEHDYDGDIKRYVFRDDSAIVTTENWWDIEGSVPFSCSIE